MTRMTIDTAPRDGTVIVVGHPDVGEFLMQWGHIQKNHYFAPGERGMWVAPHGGLTWRDGEDGPSYWVVGE
jgi:hypothetical protein